MRSLFASTPMGLEELLKRELITLGANDCQIVHGGVEFKADEPAMYRMLMGSRLASRLFLSLAKFDIYSDLDLYSCVTNLNWAEYFDVDATFAIHFMGTNDEIRDSQYGAMKVKDGIVDYFMRKVNQRPSVDKLNPDIRLRAHLHQNRVSLSLDLSGESLNKRGYRTGTGEAPIKENLAAAILMRSGWDTQTPLIDPMCGSGTLLIEGAMMAANQAPGLLRSQWGFWAWKGFNASLWQTVCSEAKAAIQPISAPIIGYDLDEQVLQRARQNAEQSGLSSAITFERQNATQLINPLPDQTGTLVCNPPYGERMGSEPALVALYTALGQRLKEAFAGWNISIYSGSEALLNCLKMRADRQFKSKNGPLDCLQKNYRVLARPQGERPQPTLVATDFTNRLRKNSEKLEKWAKKEGIECYRLYDADLPDYNVAIDRYRDRYVVQEYAAPKTIDPEKAQQRLYDVVNQVITLFQLNPNQLTLKTRAKQKGKQQYQTLDKKNEFFLVQEYGARFWVNVTDYLDTGLFLDHRLVRRQIGAMSRDLDFLNLFAYTGTASVYAGLGGAKSTTTVDMSKTYLNWADRNLKENGLTGSEHRLIQADCLTYLTQVDDRFDLIFIDPPTFSNSKRMDDTFDVQRDHLQLMTHLKRILRPKGTIIFSNNKRGFQLDYDGMRALGLQAKEITPQTLSLDFKRNRQIHCCFIITFASA